MQLRIFFGSFFQTNEQGIMLYGKETIPNITFEFKPILLDNLMMTQSRYLKCKFLSIVLCKVWPIQCLWGRWLQMTAEELKHIETRPHFLSNPPTILTQSEEQQHVTPTISIVFLVCLIKHLSIHVDCQTSVNLLIGPSCKPWKIPLLLFTEPPPPLSFPPPLPYQFLPSLPSLPPKKHMVHIPGERLSGGRGNLVIW